MLDGFAGSASTAIAALDTQNEFLVFELDPKPYNNAKQRIAKRKEQPTFFDMFQIDLQSQQATLFDNLEE
ncbi:MAG: hypothetical protein IKA31_02795 [Clostridia bacterium]|nr:hypothetical protein [Clostridia bacterium]